MSTIVVLSGGMDSATLFAALGEKATGAITVNYGQRHHREISAAESIARHYGVPWTFVDLSSLRRVLRGSALTSASIAVPHGHYADESMRSTVVPNRNMILLAVAIGHAIAQGAEAVAYGAHAGDHAVYPDCREPFAAAMTAAASLCHYEPGIRLERPFIDWTKDQIAAFGVAQGVPYALTWSCYEGGSLHCGRCGTCVERREAFTLAGVQDPTRYQP